MDDILKILASFPKNRRPLSAKGRLVYEKEYAINRTGNGIYSVVRFLESWMHRKIAVSKIPGSVLEIGAGGLNHIAYEKNVPQYDVIEPLAGQLCEKSPHRHRVNEIYSDYGVMRSMIGRHQYDRIISIAVFEHLQNLPFVIAASARLLSKNGILQVGIPSEGGFLWGFAWRLTTGISYRLRTGLSYTELMRHEHINTLDEIFLIIQYLFKNTSISFFPCFGKHGSFYSYIEASAPHRQRSKEILSKKKWRDSPIHA
ncbi:MAG: class I SAM-dependent methyltransferase [Desulfobulbaceae bacterium]|nr:class I SAM-dependent methyltransferase [Desulfobulbaceae bacterium]